MEALLYFFFPWTFRIPRQFIGFLPTISKSCISNICHNRPMRIPRVKYASIMQSNLHYYYPNIKSQHF